jgi:HEAT repeat protein
MKFHNVDEALHKIEDPLTDKETRDEAFRFLAELDDCEEAKELVKLLENDELNVRWEAARLLSQMGIKSVNAVLKALMDPKRVSDPMLREGVIHFIHILRDPVLKSKLSPLIKTLKGPAADITTMWEAYHILTSIDPKICNQ